MCRFFSLPYKNLVKKTCKTQQVPNFKFFNGWVRTRAGGLILYPRMGAEPNFPKKKPCFCARKLTELVLSLKLFFIDEIIIYIYNSYIVYSCFWIFRSFADRMCFGCLNGYVYIYICNIMCRLYVYMIYVCFQIRTHILLILGNMSCKYVVRN